LVELVLLFVGFVLVSFSENSNPFQAAAFSLIPDSMCILLYVPDAAPHSLKTDTIPATSAATIHVS
jgi:hypothetical protein